MRSARVCPPSTACGHGPLLAYAGPFDTVVGFSQGGCLAAILAALKERDGANSPLPALKTAVIMSVSVGGSSSSLNPKIE